MAELPQVSGDDAIKAFSRLGFVHVRTNGSHAVLKKEGFEYILSVPLHDKLKRGTLRSLIRVAGLTVEDFKKQL